MSRVEEECEAEKGSAQKERDDRSQSKNHGETANLGLREL
jgi:hypothetical protein